MLKSYILYKDPLIYYYNCNISNNVIPLNESDFVIIKYFVQFLNFFYDVVVTLPRVYYFTLIMTLHHLYEILLIFDKFNDYSIF
jgi:hypothetical protein